MAHTQKPDFVFRRNGRVHLNQRGRQFSRLLVSRGVRISGSNAGCTMFRGSVKGTGYPLHSPGFPSLRFPRVAVCHHIFSWSLQSLHLSLSVSYQLLDLPHSLQFRPHILESNSHHTRELLISSLGDLTMSNLAYLTVSVLPSWSV